MPQMKDDITSQDDVKRLVDTFYDRVNQDELLAPIFNDVAKVDWNEHLPVMYSFWGAMLLGEGTFYGRPFPKHAVLPVDQTHYERWLTLFGNTIDLLFAGPKADEARLRALCIADTFAMRTGVLKDPEALNRAVGTGSKGKPVLRMAPGSA